MNRSGWVVAAALLALAVAASATLFECVDPKEPPCTASSEENKKKCPHECKTWVEVSEKQWLATLQKKEPAARRGANFTLDAAIRSLYHVDVFPGDTPPKTAAVYASPEKYNLRTLRKGEVKEGTLFVLPNITGIVKEPAADPLDSVVVYSSASLGGKPAEGPLRFLVTEAQPKFVEPAKSALPRF